MPSLLDRSDSAGALSEKGRDFPLWAMATAGGGQGLAAPLFKPALQDAPRKMVRIQSKQRHVVEHAGVIGPEPPLTAEDLDAARCRDEWEVDEELQPEVKIRCGEKRPPSTRSGEASDHAPPLSELVRGMRSWQRSSESAPSARPICWRDWEQQNGTSLL